MASGPPTVPVSGRTPPEVKELARRAARAEGHPSLSKFVGEAVERETLRVLRREGLIPREGAGDGD